jgi:transposase
LIRFHGLNNLPLFRKIKRKQKYLLLKNPNNLTKKDKVGLDELMEYQHLDTVQAYGLVLEFKKMFDYKKSSHAAKYRLVFLLSWIDLI